MSLHVALYQPEIPPNTGNIIRLCANSGAELHLIHPLGFSLDTKQLRRAGLDYHEWAHIHEYADYDDFITKNPHKNIYACTTKAQQHHSDATYQEDDVLLFGPETRGLPTEILDTLPSNKKIRIPMCENSRSLNLSNATAIILYEAYRQIAYPNMQ